MYAGRNFRQQMKKLEQLKDWLPIGYLYLVILGVLKEGVFFYQLGIDVLKFSPISDIFMSPVADIFSDPVILGAFVLVMLLVYVYLRILEKLAKKPSVRQVFSGKGNPLLTDEEMKAKMRGLLNICLGIGVLCFFVGTGLGGGNKTRRRIEENRMEYRHKVTFGTGETEEVYLIDSNSAYCFYVSKGQRTIKIAPMGAVKSIELIDNRMLETKKTPVAAKG
jgi:hypothetical protein